MGTPVPEGDVIERVVRSAMEFTVARGGESTGTGDLLFALFDIYGRTMDRALFMHGITPLAGVRGADRRRAATRPARDRLGRPAGAAAGATSSSSRRRKFRK